MNFVLLGLLGATLLIVLWMSAQLTRVRTKLAAIPEDADVPALLKRVDNDLAQLEHAVTGLEPRLAAIEKRLPHAISYTGVVSYDAFGDITGNLSRSIAMLDRNGDGLIISLLVGRSETRFFTKQVRSRAGAEPLSPEEESAVAQALAG